MTQYRDKDGDIWEDQGDEWEIVHSQYSTYVGRRERRFLVELNHGPLTEVNPHADAATSRAIRVELALVLDEMAKDVWSPYNYSGIDDDIRSTVSAIFEEKARQLREAAG